MLLIVMPLLGGYVIVATLLRLIRVRARRVWFATLLCASAIGLVAGCWLSLCFHYYYSPTLRVHSFPLPLSCHRLEHDRWVCYEMGPVVYLGILANVVAVTAVAVLPVLVSSLAVHRRGGRNRSSGNSPREDTAKGKVAEPESR